MSLGSAQGHDSVHIEGLHNSLHFILDALLFVPRVYFVRMGAGWLAVVAGKS